MITDILSALNDTEQKQLNKLLLQHDSQPYQIIRHSMEGHTDKAWLIKKLNISESSYFKNLTLARDVLFEVIKSAKTNQYDDIILVRRLYLRGLEQRALEWYHKLEKDYEAEQLWGALDILYHEAVRIYYTKCDLKMLAAVNKKVAVNIDRYAVYTKLDKKLLLEMAFLEKSELSPREINSLEKRVKILLDEAENLKHHVLIFNALRCWLEVYTKFNISVEKSQEIIARMEKLDESKLYKLNPYTKSVLYLNAFSFFTMFVAKQSPEKYMTLLKPVNEEHSLQIAMPVLFNYVCYYFMTGNEKQFEAFYSQLLEAKTEKEINYLKDTARCMWYYKHGNYPSFAKCRNDFYLAYDNRAYQEYDLMIRYLELLVMLRERDFSLWKDRMEALEKFMRRNFSPSRFAVEKAMLKSFKNKETGKPLAEGKPIYRFHTWLAEQIAQIK